MRTIIAMLLAAFASLVAATKATAHYHILLPDKPAGAKDEPVTLSLQFGRPFEHKFVSVPKPRRVAVVAPDGVVTELNAKLEQVEHATTTDVPRTSFRWKYTPTQRGDYVFSIVCDPLWTPDLECYVQDVTKVAYHVEAQKNWDAPAGTHLDLLPLTRPYGLRPASVFRALAVGRPPEDGGINSHRVPLPDAQPLPGVLVEVERLNLEPPKGLPPDEHMTMTLKTCPAGVAAVTLFEPGWWSLTAVRDTGMRQRGGKAYPVLQRATLWVHVDGPVPLAPAK